MMPRMWSNAAGIYDHNGRLMAIIPLVPLSKFQLHLLKLAYDRMMGGLDYMHDHPKTMLFKSIEIDIDQFFNLIDKWIPEVTIRESRNG